MLSWSVWTQLVSLANYWINRFYPNLIWICIYKFQSIIHSSPGHLTHRCWSASITRKKKIYFNHCVLYLDYNMITTPNTTSPLNSGLLSDVMNTENSIPNTITNSNHVTNNTTTTRTKKRSSKQGEFDCVKFTLWISVIELYKTYGINLYRYS